MRRLWVVLGFTVFVAAIAAGPPASAAEPPDNYAVVINEEDGTTLHEVAFMALLTTGEVVDASNTAVALTSCSECRSVAVAVQVLVAVGPTQVTADNLSAAVTELCDGCASIAIARQLVIVTNTPIDLSPAALRALDRLRRHLTTFEHVLSTPAGQRVPTRVIVKKVEHLERQIDRELGRALHEITRQLTQTG